MTGWGQEGPLAQAAGHDINYIALTGALHAIGGKDRPTPPLNLVGDFGGGGMLLAFGMVCGLLEARRSGKGQVVDAAMVDGAALLMGGIYGMAGAGLWNDERPRDQHAGRRRALLRHLRNHGRQVSSASARSSRSSTPSCSRRPACRARALPAQMDRKAWPQLESRLAGIFPTKTRDEWCAIMEGTDICFAPVLTMKEALEHPHAKARGAYVDVSGFPQPAPAAALLAHQGEHQGPGRQARPAHRRDAEPARLLGQGDRRAEGGGRGRAAVGARHEGAFLPVLWGGGPKGRGGGPQSSAIEDFRSQASLTSPVSPSSTSPV